MAACAHSLHAVVDASHVNARARVGGLTLTERMLFVLSRAGARSAHLLVPPGSGEGLAKLRVPVGFELRLVEGDGPVEPTGARSLVVVAAHLVLSVPAMRHFIERARRVEGLASACLGGRKLPLAHCRWADFDAVRDRVRRSEDSTGAESENVPLEGPDTLALLVRSDKELIAAEKALLAALGRPDDGAFTRLIDRKISLAITRRLATTSLSPSAVTMVSIACGIAAGAVMAAGGYPSGVLGSALFLASTILDGCDGELARLKFLESRLGAILDIGGDNLVHVAVFGGLAIGLHRQDPGLPMQTAGTALVVGLVAAMATSYWCVFRNRATAAQRALFNAFASREFVYLMLLLALAGRLLWFFWLALAGTYVFSAALLALGRLGAEPPGAGRQGQERGQAKKTRARDEATQRLASDRWQRQGGGPWKR